MIRNMADYAIRKASWESRVERNFTRCFGSYKRHLRKQDMMAGLQGSSVDLKKSNENGNGLLLYQYYASFYSQKVVFALNEKKLKFKSQIVDLFRGEQFEPWFIKLNPKSEVPVLKDGVKIIPDSRRIIDYIEDNFSNGNTPRLTPEKGSAQYQTMERMRDLLDNVPAPIITFGIICNPELAGDMKLPAKEIKLRQGIFDAQSELLSALCEKYKDHKDHYVARKSIMEKKQAMVKNVNEVEKAILDAEYALKEVEKVLGTHVEDKKDWWLCCEKFTIADISLCVLLKRIENLGLAERFFKSNELPKVQEYYKRAQQRDSFKKTFSQNSNILKTIKCMETKEQVFVTVGGIAVLIAAAGIATFLIHRNK